MAGFISNLHVRAPDGPWEKWRDAIVLANAGSTKLADRLLGEILDHPILCAIQLVAGVKDGLLSQRDILIVHRLVDQRQAIGADLAHGLGGPRKGLPVPQLCDRGMGKMETGIADQRGVEFLGKALDGHHRLLPAFRSANEIGELWQTTVIGVDQRLATPKHGPSDRIALKGIDAAPRADCLRDTRIVVTLPGF